MNQPLSFDKQSISHGDTAIAMRDAVWINAVLQQSRQQRNQAEQEKLRLAERLQALLNALPAALLVLDGNGRVSECNPAAEELLQIPLRGRLWRELIRELFSLQTQAGDALQLHNGRLVTLSTRPLGSEPGQMVMLQDVTDTQQLRSRLEHSRRLADMGRMAASLAHQIRTPLASALLYVSQMQSTRLSAEKRGRFSTKAMESLKGLEKLIDDMLLFARDGRGEREPLLPAELLAPLAEETNRRRHETGVRCVAETTGDGRMILANRVLLKSALQNLLNNALEAGAKNIRLQGCGDSSWCEMTISDDGTGIAMEQQQRIFEPFFSGRSGGSGLGLAVVRAVVQSMGGEVGLHSRPGEGAVFTLRFPTVSDISKAEAVAATAAEQG